MTLFVSDKFYTQLYNIFHLSITPLHILKVILIDFILKFYHFISDNYHTKVYHHPAHHSLHPGHLIASLIGQILQVTTLEVHTTHQKVKICPVHYQTTTSEDRRRHFRYILPIIGKIYKLNYLLGLIALSAWYIYCYLIFFNILVSRHWLSKCASGAAK